MEQYRLTRLEIDLDVIARNARLLRARTPAQVKMMAVVKADAYGHGAVEVSRAALANGADALAVAIPEEGVALREAGIEAPVLVLGGVNAAGAEAEEVGQTAQQHVQAQDHGHGQQAAGAPHLQLEGVHKGAGQGQAEEAGEGQVEKGEAQQGHQH